MNVVLATGGFDPLHSGHVAYLNAAKELGDILVVGLNSDEWLIQKKGKAFLPLDERNEIVRNLKSVDQTIVGFDDSDGSAKDALIKIRRLYKNDHIIFVNGGDRTSENIPEMDVADENISFVFGVGGEDKKNSSSWILKKWNVD